MGKVKFVLDSTTVIDFAKGALGPASALSALLNGKLYISVITRIETLVFPGITPAEESHIRELLTIFKVIPLNKKVERATVLIRSKTKRKLPDSIIAATALSIGAVLISRDIHMLNLNWPGLTVITAAT